jgi:NAD(P)-dependent dehydrogenase (short-subunit alcohol dehydrogenase family)
MLEKIKNEVKHMPEPKRIVVVTGAGSGIGRGVALAYAKEGATVVLADSNEEGCRDTERIIRERSGDAFVQVTDVRRPEQIEHLMHTVREKYARLDVLINNAGVSRWKSPYDLTVEEWDDIININLRGYFLCAREAAKIMKEQPEGGRIVNMASTRALQSEANTEAYAATKGGIVALTHALAVSLGPDKILVNAISPGWIETGDYGALKAEDHSQHPAGRVGTVEDIARACLYLTDRQNDFVTGINLVVDGGMTRKMIYEE